MSAATLDIDGFCVAEAGFGPSGFYSEVVITIPNDTDSRDDVRLILSPNDARVLGAWLMMVTEKR